MNWSLNLDSGHKCLTNIKSRLTTLVLYLQTFFSFFLSLPFFSFFSLKLCYSRMPIVATIIKLHNGSVLRSNQHNRNTDVRTCNCRVKEIKRIQSLVRNLANIEYCVTSTFDRERYQGSTPAYPKGRSRQDSMVINELFATGI